MIRDHMRLTGEDLRGQAGGRGGRGDLHGHDAAHRLSDAARGGRGEGAYRDPDAGEQLPLRDSMCCPAMPPLADSDAAGEDAGLFRGGQPDLSCREQSFLEVGEGRPARSAPAASKPET